MRSRLGFVALGAALVSCGGGSSAPPAGAAGAGGGASGGASGAGGSAGAPDVTPRDFDAEDPGIQYTGRVDFSDPQAPRFSAPGVYIKARFRGDAVTVLVRDQFKDGNNNYFDAIVDDAPAVKITPERNVTEYAVAEGLPYGEHTVTFVKRTEATVGYAEFLGFRFGGEILPAPPRPERKLVFIGDSISAGSGVEAENASQECSEDGWGQPYHNAHFAFGPIAARALGADYHVTAVGGIGLTQNWSTRWDARTMPEVFDLTFVERRDSPLWDQSVFGRNDGQEWEGLPDGVVIALGTNDFSTGDPDDPANWPETTGGTGGVGASGGASAAGGAGAAGAPVAGGVAGASAGGAGTGGTSGGRVYPTPESFAAAYIVFIDRLRGYYPDAHFFCVSSPMLGNNWPSASYHFADDLNDALARVEAHYDDGRVHAVYVDRQVGNGCGKHPDLAEQTEAALDLEDAIGAALSW